MAKEVIKILKLQITGGMANPAPPIGPALGQQGLNIQNFCSRFNEATKDKKGEVVPCEIMVYNDRTFDFILKTPPASELLKKEAGIKKGSQKPLTEKVGTVTKEQIRKIAEIKLPDLNTQDINSAMNSIEGTARQMGIKVEG